MQPTAKEELLRMRIVHALTDDEEYLEEIYIHVNCDLEERITSSRKCRFYRLYRKAYRLTEILEALVLMTDEALVTSRTVGGYHPCCGFASKLFRLTTKGQSYWEDTVRGTVEALYD